MNEENLFNGSDEEDLFNLMEEDIDSPSNDLENWFPNTNILGTGDNFCDLGIEPLSRAQIFESSHALEGLEVSPVTSKVLPKVITPIKKRDLSNFSKNPDDVTTTTEYDFVKNFTLANKTPATMQLTKTDGKIFFTLHERNGKQMFLLQQLMNHHHALAKCVENKQKIVNVSMLKIYKALEYQLPQLVTNFGLKICLCPLHCDKAYPHIADAKVHVLQHMGIKPYKCDKPGCVWAFYTASKLQRHKDTHDKIKIFACTFDPLCTRRFSTVYNLQDHIRKHKIPNHLRCTVESCTASFQNETQRKHHYKSHNKNEAPFKCTNRKCKRVFFNEMQQKNHLLSCKDSENTCRYPDCGKTFQNPFRLKEHVRVHTGAKPYNCTLCHRKFSSSSKLNRHIDSHVGHKKHLCKFEGCNKSFLRSDHLKKHMLTHNMAITIYRQVEEVVANENPDNLAEAGFITDPADLFEQEQLLAVQTIQGITEEPPSEILLTTIGIPDETEITDDDSLSTVNLQDLE